DFSLVDRLRLTYSRQYVAANNQLRFTVGAGQAARLTGFTSAAVRLLDITDAQHVGELLVEAKLGDDGNYSFALPPAATARTLLAFATGPESLTPVPGRLSNWRSANHKADLLILTHGDFHAAADRLATQR